MVVRRGVPLACAILIVLTTACSGSTSSHSARPSTPSRSTRPTVPVTAPPEPHLDWRRLHNPILSSPDHALKDPALVAAQSPLFAWYLLESVVDTHGTWRVGIEHSTDLHTWSPMTLLPHDPAVEGEASPDVTLAPNGRYVVTYQSFPHDAHGGMSKLYYRTTTDFARFSPARPLGLPLHQAPGDRMIDPALAWTPAGLLLGYKTGNPDGALAFEIARSPTRSLDGPWQLVGRPDIHVYGDTIENDQFIRIAGQWKLIATSNQLDRPFLFDLAGAPVEPSAWLHWSPGRQLAIPQESWNPGTGITGATYEHANGAYLIDHRAADGHFYLVYEDAPEMSTFGGQGHGTFGIARSTDLVHWSVPPN